MKSKLIKACIILGLGIALTVSGSGSTRAYAMGPDEVENTELKDAIALVSGEKTVVDFDSEVGNNNLYKITTAANGILTFKIKGTYHNMNRGDFKYMRVQVYNDKGVGVICGEAEVDDSNDKFATWYAPLPAGVYYVNFKGGGGTYNNFVSGTSDLIYTFEATDQCELENNNVKEKTEFDAKANVIKVDTVITGFGGYVALDSTSDAADIGDAYKVYLQKGYTYKFATSQVDKGIFKMWDKAEKLHNLADRIDANKEFVAQKTGWYYIDVWNTLGKQFKYTIEVQTVKAPAPETKLKSVSCKKKVVTVKWSAKSCDGYEIQYATNKKFKSAKTVKVKDGKMSSTKIKKLKKGKKYFFRMRTVKKFAKATSYSGWTKVKTVTIK